MYLSYVLLIMRGYIARAAAVWLFVASATGRLGSNAVRGDRSAGNIRFLEPDLWDVSGQLPLNSWCLGWTVFVWHLRKPGQHYLQNPRGRAPMAVSELTTE